jgi:hypothetical protein
MRCITRRGHVLSMRQGPYIQSSSPATASRYSVCGHRPRETITLAWTCVGISLHVRPTVCTFTEMQDALSCRVQRQSEHLQVSEAREWGQVVRLVGWLHGAVHAESVQPSQLPQRRQPAGREPSAADVQPHQLRRSLRVTEHQ